MLIDCDTCAAPASVCDGCVMTVLLRGRAGRPPGGRGRDEVELDDAERDAIGALAHAGLVPPLRLVRGVHATGSGCTADAAGSWAANASQGIA